MTQNREPPAYQEYAASMMAKQEYRTMTLQDRGLLYTMRLECWVNTFLPNDHHKLAKILGFDVAEIAASLPAVMSFFQSDGDQLSCPELIAYRAHLDSIKERKSAGGKNSAEAKKGKRKSAKTLTNTDDVSILPSILQESSQVSCKSLVQSNPVKQSQTQSPKKGGDVDPFIAEYEAAERKNVAAGANRIKVEL
jgi:uncharacterized protein YdaU (DUF1376 family)